MTIVPLEFAGRRAWGVKDPVALTYYELSLHEFFLLERLDGVTTVTALCDEFNQTFAPQTLAPAELQAFVAQLITQGLVIAESPGAGLPLTLRRRRVEARLRLQHVTNLLCLRFRGIDPSRLLDRLQPILGGIWSRAALVWGTMLIAAALLLVTVQWKTVVHRLPEAQALLSVPNLVWLPLLLAMVKVLHELGHGLTCRRFGAECRELGVMLLVFTPTLYCNVSDMWMVREKWKRIAVSAAGIWVELLIASTCTLLWWFSAPGLFHSLCLNLMIVCSVSTVLFNGNPLLRYDGYFILADWLEIPNLQQESLAAWRGSLAAWYCGIPIRQLGDNRVRRSLLLGYGALSAVYRVILTVLILWSLNTWLGPYGLGPVVQLLAIPLVAAIVVVPLMRAVRFLKTAENQARIQWNRLTVRLLGTAILASLVLAVPIPTRIGAGAWLDDAPAQKVYAALGGILVESLPIGASVDNGQELARLTDPRLDRELARLDGEQQQQRLRLEQLQRRRIQDASAAALIPSVREHVQDLEGQVQQLRDTASRLILRAPQSGMVLPAPPREQAASTGSLSSWSGQPLDPRNRGCYLEPGTTVCLVGPEESPVALLLVHQHEINLVAPGQTVRVAWRELPGQIQTGTVTEIAALDLDRLPRQALERLKIPVRQQAGVVRPVETLYQVRVSLNAAPASVVRSAVGDARIEVSAQSLGFRAWRWMTRTFLL